MNRRFFEDLLAVNAVKSWVYSPTLLNGVPVPVVMAARGGFTPPRDVGGA